MPWDIQKQGNQHCVVKKDGTVIKCHPTREMAVAHQRALYANADKTIETELARGKGLLATNDDGVAVIIAANAAKKKKKKRKPGVWGYEKPKGGAGSGNFGHAGRPGLVGGSASDGPHPTPANTRTIMDAFDRLYNRVGDYRDREPEEQLDSARMFGKIADENTAYADEEETLESHRAAAEAHDLAAQNYAAAAQLIRVRDQETAAISKEGREANEAAGRHALMAIYEREQVRRLE